MCVNKDTVVLVIDDCEDNLFLMELVLVSDGYKVATACNGKEGLAKASELNPNLIILDMMMPDMSGSEVIAHLKADGKLAEIPIILCTANKRISKQEVKGIVDIYYKPFDIEEMVTKINSFVECCQDGRSSTKIADKNQANFSPIKHQPWQSIFKIKLSMPIFLQSQELPIF